VRISLVMMIIIIKRARASESILSMQKGILRQLVYECMYMYVHKETVDDALDSANGTISEDCCHV
jgi:hypothetical protein